MLWSILFADDMVLIGERKSPEELNGSLEEWKECDENKGQRNSRDKYNK